MYLLDTNVISEVRKPKPHGAVLAWLASLPKHQVFLSAVTIGELQTGIELTRRQDPAKADLIEAWVEMILFEYVVIPMDSDCFRQWAKFMSDRSGDQTNDAMIAATARVHGLTVVTRNVRDFEPFDVPVLDPFANPQS